MAHTTTCPACGTTFRITAGQLLARNGNVRCGRCSHVFNAHESLKLGFPAPPPLPVAEPPAPRAVAPLPVPPPPVPEPIIEPPPSPLVEAMEAALPDVATPSLPSEPPAPPTVEEPVYLAPVETAPPEPQSEAPLVLEEFTPLDEVEEVVELPAAPTEMPTEPVAVPPQEVQAEPAPPAVDDAEIERLAAQLHAEAISAVTAAAPRVPAPDPAPPVPPAEVLPEPAQEPAPSAVTAARTTPPWLLVSASLVLLVALLLQGTLAFRSELAAQSPAARAFLEQLCGVLGCQVALPRNPDLLSIETSALEAVPGHPGIVALSAVLRNRAAVVQEYPAFELSLTDYRDQLIARKIFLPRDYLPVADGAARGMPGGEEIDVKLHLDLGDLQAAGYRVYLFYSATTS